MLRGLCAVIIGACVCLNMIYANDISNSFSKKSNEELIKEAGVYVGEKAAEFSIEVKKRLHEMDKALQEDFIDKIKKSYKENTKNLSLEELQKREKAFQESIEKYTEKMSEEAKKKYGITKEWIKNVVNEW